MTTHTISEVALLLAVSIQTLRRWDRSGSLSPDFRTAGGHRRYTFERIRYFMGLATENQIDENKPAILYSRVSSSKQVDD